MSNHKKHIAVLTGAGVSAESGLLTFRDSGGLWEGYDVMQVASIEGWQQNQGLVLDFYNMRRKQAASAQPNAGHYALVDLEKAYKVDVITQNVDDLHEKAGSSNVLHLHGKLSEVRSSVDASLIYDIYDKPIELGKLCPKGSQLRPNIVWFGEMVPNIEPASHIISEADILIIAGTSLLVYPAAGLVHAARHDAEIYLVDPIIPDSVVGNPRIQCFQEKAGTGLKKLAEKLLGYISE